jgi:hypothetical protein
MSNEDYHEPLNEIANETRATFHLLLLTMTTSACNKKAITSYIDVN